MGISFSSESSSIMESNVTLGKTRMSIQARSQGDGMETVVVQESFMKDYFNFRDPVVIKQNHSNSFSSMNGRRKEPKFIPYEPYKAAVSPILPKNLDKHYLENSLIDPSLVKPLMSEIIYKSSRNVTCEHLDDSDAKCSLEIKENADYEPKQELENVTWLAEKLVLENKVKQLTEEKKNLEAQFNIQTKVNSDLKKLLVASLGEDIEAKVQYMSEDKAKLGEHVLLYSQKLSQNNEELEKLSVQCDLWKSKFEASCLMVDELVAWKVVLSKKFKESTNSLQCLLKEHDDIFHQLSESFWILHLVQETFDPSARKNSPSPQSPWNLPQLVCAVRGLSDEIQSRLLGSSPYVSSRNNNEEAVTRGLTQSELKANEVIKSIGNLLSLTRKEINERRKTKIGSHACSHLAHVCSKEATVNCCKHCSGEIRLI